LVLEGRGQLVLVALLELMVQILYLALLHLLVAVVAVLIIVPPLEMVAQEAAQEILALLEQVLLDKETMVELLLVLILRITVRLEEAVLVA
jgi:hypothetical protein